VMVSMPFAPGARTAVPGVLLAFESACACFPPPLEAQPAKDKAARRPTIRMAGFLAGG
jgi:hypothetical protein